MLCNAQVTRDYDVEDSQIAAAYSADIILLGEVLDLGKPIPTGQFPIQFLTLRNIEVIKGRLSSKTVTLRIGFSWRSTGVSEEGDVVQLSTTRFKVGNRFIVLFHRKFTGGECTPSPSGDINPLCYIFQTRDLIPFSSDDLNGVRLLAGKGRR